MDQLIGLLMLARELAHREHILTNSYPAHKALGKFQDKVGCYAEKIAKVAIGYGVTIDSIPFVDNEHTGPIDVVLELQSQWIADNAPGMLPEGASGLEDLLDEVQILYRKTIYGLRQYL